MVYSSDPKIFIEQNFNDIYAITGSICQKLGILHLLEDMSQEVYLHLLSRNYVCSNFNPDMTDPKYNGNKKPEAMFSTYLYVSIRNYVLYLIKNYNKREGKSVYLEPNLLDYINGFDYIDPRYENLLDSNDMSEKLREEYVSFELLLKKNSRLRNKWESKSKKFGGKISASDLWKYYCMGYSYKQMSEMSGVSAITIQYFMADVKESFQKYFLGDSVLLKESMLMA